MTADEAPLNLSPSIPWFGARRMARRLAVEIQSLRNERDTLRSQLNRLTGMSNDLVSEVKELRAERVITLQQLESHGALDLYELDHKKRILEKAIIAQSAQLALEKERSLAILKRIDDECKRIRTDIVETDEIRLLQEAGIYRYRHPLTDAVDYEGRLDDIQTHIKAMVKKDGGAVLATTSWTVNGSAAEGRAMVRDFSKLLLRAFNAEADNMVRGMKPYKLDSALSRLSKVATTIERLGASMHIQISPAYHQLRVKELELTADFLEKHAEEKAQERAERERLREERKVAQEIERERAKLEKEREHYTNALTTLMQNGDENGAARIRAQLVDVEHAIENVDYRAANIRAGYVYVISNVGSFGRQGRARRHSQQPVTGTQTSLDKHLHAQRHLAECCFPKLKQFRRAASASKRPP